MNCLTTGKIKIMKKIVSIIIVVLLATSCTDQEGDRNYNYRISNNSGVVIEMMPFYNGVKDISNKVIVKNLADIKYQFTDTPPDGGGPRMEYIALTSSKIQNNLTHIEVFFDNKKKVIYQECTATNQCFNQPRNIFNPVFSAEQTEVYTITPEDYQNAQDCGGNCN